jgi:hypothetical protein
LNYMKTSRALIFLLLGNVLPLPAAVVALDVTPTWSLFDPFDASYDLDQDGQADLMLDSETFVPAAIGNFGSTTFISFGRGAGLSLMALPSAVRPEIDALTAHDVVGASSYFADDTPGWGAYLVGYSGSAVASPSGYYGDFQGLRTALVGFRLTKNGKDHFGVLELKLFLDLIISRETVEEYGMTPPDAPLVDGYYVLPTSMPGVRITGGWMETEAGKSFAASSVPEPGRGVLTLAGGVWLVLRRRRAALGAG